MHPLDPLYVPGNFLLLSQAFPGLLPLAACRSLRIFPSCLWWSWITIVFFSQMPNRISVLSASHRVDITSPHPGTLLCWIFVEIPVHVGLVEIFLLVRTGGEVGPRGHLDDLNKCTECTGKVFSWGRGPFVEKSPTMHISYFDRDL